MKFTKYDKLFFIFLILFYLTLFYLSSLNSFFADEGTHAVVSLFYRDMILNIGNIGFDIQNIYAFGMDYMAHYPKLQVTYPPLYHIVTGLVFYSLFGISAITAKLSVIVFSMLSAVALYFLVRKVFDDRIALLSTFLFFVNSMSIFYSYRVLTDFSAWLFVFLAVYVFLKAIEKNSSKYYLLTGLLAFLAAMGKRPAIILMAVLVLYNLVFRRNIKGSILMAGIFTVLMLPYAFIMLQTGGLDIQMMVVQTAGIEQGEPALLTIDNWIWYPVNFIQHTGPISVVFLASLAVYVYRKEKYWKPILLWVLVFWIGLSMPQNKELRFFQFIFLPAYVVFSYYFFRFGKNIKVLLPAVVLIVIYAAGSFVFVMSDMKHNTANDVVSFVNHDVNGNIAVISDRGDIYSSEFIFLFAASDANKEKFVYRPCAFADMTKNEILDYIKDNNIEYIIAVNKGTGDKTFYGYDNLEKIKDELLFVKNFGDIDVYKISDFSFVPGETCNKICLTNQIICTNNSTPFELLN